MDIIFGNFIGGIAYVLNSLLSLYWWVVIIAVVASWLNADPSNPIVRFLRNVTEPALYQIRRALPFVYSFGLDFSPVILLLGIQFTQIVLVNSLMALRVRLGSGGF